MDEVDFTILAATSVLGDLIEKCPPAEACRDAFDRMSKATVQMCMSTTGFSSSAQGLNSRRHSSNHHQNRPDLQSNGRRSHKIQQPSRPKPHFDMGLNDLLAPTTPPYPPQTVKRENDFEYPGNQNMMRQDRQSHSVGHSPVDYAVSPTLSNVDTSAIDPSLLPSPSQQTPSYSNFSTGQGSMYPPPQGEMQFPFSNAPGMDFLNQNNTGWDMGQQGNGQGGHGGQNWTGDLGIGLGWEGMDHDFSEGGNGGVDLFDGFFFGGTGNF